MHIDVHDFLDSLSKPEEAKYPQVKLRTGVVDSAPAGTPPRVNVKIGGSDVASTGIRFLASVSPAVGDVVSLLQVEGTFIIIGAFAGAGTATSWQTWTPALSGGAMTVTPGSHAANHARYVVVGKVCHVSYSQLVTTSGVAAPSITVSLPVTPATARLTGSGDINNVIARCSTGDAVSPLSLTRYDGANLPLTVMHVSFHLTYEVA